ncbi:MAG: hypothetical protein PF487_08020 [Bacteroidales bacterium]|jgi:type II secretory ATPase GspE/PulE/Tfp pilus assembly ATPase PilB-like protein|nr:hypothetical protein [Bacteroidales bacterium]
MKTNLLAKCDICKQREATQKELTSVSSSTNFSTNETKVKLWFNVLCKTCSKEKYDYDQETIDAMLESVQEEIEKGADISDNWDNGGLMLK